MDDISLENFKTDFMALASGKKSGIMEPWYYSDHSRNKALPGSSLWDIFLNYNELYYILKNEIELVKSSVSILKQEGHLQKFDTVVDFGVGSKVAVQEKALPLVRACSNAQTYAPIDLSQKFLDEAKDILKAETPHIKTQPYKKDFFHDEFDLPGQKKIGGFFGSTISNIPMFQGTNFPQETIVQRLTHIAHLMGSSNEILMGFDANPSLENAKTMYDHEMWRMMILGVLYDVEQFLKPEGYFQPKDWQHEFVINEESHTIHQLVVANKTQEFQIDKKEFVVQAGEGWLMSNNTKIPVSKAKQVSQESGMEVADSFQDKQKKMTLMRLVIS